MALMAYIALAAIVFAAVWIAEDLGAPGFVYLILGLAFFVALAVIAEVFSRRES